jgi:murein DD-endopeptidase MepM/ murein hydrolase activator NlpD
MKLYHLIGLALFFPAVASAASPFSKIPEWGAMTSPAEWNRTYSEYKVSELITPPGYDLKVLTTPLADLMVDQKKNMRSITAKIYYSTRYCGSYDVDADEFSGDHCAIDLKAPIGTPILAVKAGTVTEVSYDKLLGNFVTIRTPNGNVWLYGHLKESIVKKGRVREGQVIGYVGETGNTYSPHLHLQLNDKSGKPMNPVPYLP